MLAFGKRARDRAKPPVTTRIALVLCAALSTPASAQGPMSPLRMTCDDAMSLVKREGTVTLGAGGAKVERFVRDRSFCDLSEIAELRFVPTRDNPECPVGYRCREPDYGDWDWR